MIGTLFARVLELLDSKPYGLEQFIREGNPQDHSDLERLERMWIAIQNRKFFHGNY